MVDLLPTTFLPHELYYEATQFLPRALVSNEHVARTLKLTELIPKDFFIERFGFEIPLGQVPKSVDTSICLALDRPLESLLRQFRPESLAPTLRRENSWKTLLTQLRSSVNEQFFLKKRIDHLWLEFDLVNTVRWPPAPNLFFSYNPQTTSTDSALQSLLFFKSAAPLHKVEELIAHAAHCRLGVVNMGHMKARRSRWFKLGLSSKNLSEVLPSFLKRIAYSYPYAPLLRLLNQVKGTVKVIDLQMDVSEKIHPKISIECFTNWDTWTPFLEVMVQQGLISKEELAAIRAWCGGTSYKFCHEKAERLLFRHISHFKIIFEPGKTLRLKAYLGVMPKNIPH